MSRLISLVRRNIISHVFSKVPHATSFSSPSSTSSSASAANTARKLLSKWLRPKHDDDDDDYDISLSHYHSIHRQQVYDTSRAEAYLRPGRYSRAPIMNPQQQSNVNSISSMSGSNKPTSTASSLGMSRYGPDSGVIHRNTDAYEAQGLVRGIIESADSFAEAATCTTSTSIASGRSRKRYRSPPPPPRSHRVGVAPGAGADSAIDIGPDEMSVALARREASARWAVEGGIPGDPSRNISHADDNDNSFEVHVEINADTDGIDDAVDDDVDDDGIGVDGVYRHSIAHTLMRARAAW
jgi:hypothetical protein